MVGGRGLLLIEFGFEVAFIQGSDVFVGTGKTVGPWGETPLEVPLVLKPRWGVYAAVAAAVVGLLAAVGAGLASRVGPNQTLQQTAASSVASSVEVPEGRRCRAGSFGARRPVPARSVTRGTQ